MKRAYAPWEVTRIPTGGLTFWAKSTEDTIKGNGAGGTAMMNMVTDTLGIKWHKFDSSASLSGTPKLWDGTSEGWYAHVDKSRLLYIKKFTDIPASKKAPVNENQIELYSTTNKSYLEMELQGAFDSIPAGDSLTWDVKWYVRKLPDSIPVTRNAALAAFVRQTISDGPVSVSSQVGSTTVGFRLGSTSRRISVDMDKGANVSLAIVNSNGREISRVHAGRLSQGHHEFALNSAMPKGVYWIVLKDANRPGILSMRKLIWLQN